jgi:hypothetical protein
MEAKLFGVIDRYPADRRPHERRVDWLSIFGARRVPTKGFHIRNTAFGAFCSGLVRHAKS